MADDFGASALDELPHLLNVVSRHQFSAVLCDYACHHGRCLLLRLSVGLHLPEIEDIPGFSAFAGVHIAKVILWFYILCTRFRPIGKV